MSTSANRNDPTIDRAKQYSRWKIGFFIVGLVFSWVGSAIFYFGGWSRSVDRSVKRNVAHPRASEAGTIVAFTLISWLASLPLAYLRGYRLEHRFGLSNYTHASWLVDQIKGLALQLVLLVPLTQIVLGIIRRRPGDWWLVLSGLALPFTVVMAQLFPVLIAPIFNTYQPLRDRELAERLKALAARSGIEVAEVLEVDMSRQTKAANASFAGIGSTKRIALGDTLLAEFTPEEIETIVAHEIGHQKHRDLWRLLALGTATTTAILWATQRIYSVLQNRLSVSGPGVAESLPLLSLVGSVAGMLVVPLQNAFVRYIERQADQYAMEITDDPDSFASALDRLKTSNLADPDPSRLEVVLLHSHPSISERIESTQRFKRERAR